MKMLLWVGALALAASGCGDDGGGAEDAGTDARILEIDGGPDAGRDAGPDGGRRDTGPICPGDPRCGCAAPLVACGDACVDTRTDAAHCGACDTPCGAGESCVAGACEACVAPN